MYMECFHQYVNVEQCHRKLANIPYDIINKTALILSFSRSLFSRLTNNCVCTYGTKGSMN